MKKILFIMAAAMLVFAGCKKDKTEKTGGNNTWTLAGTTYKVAYTNKSATSGARPSTLVIFADAGFNDPKVNTFNLSFATPPTASGTFQLMGGAGGDITGNQFELFAGGDGKAYAYLGTAIDVAVEVTGGKIKVTIPEIMLKSASGGADVKLTASVYEK
ncbi:hypothetical protein EWM62_13505 [Mucilaginibacter terrigena]|uniref:Lipocalin-like domain-containing protein n=1 Tax=Mucilaginibacter terrigena TaxID=2492395 RepID=A0A4Q5LL17_9SPHI|nr:hypothetical protein [Mucilaginibacter terrigena]RYU89342.1 hypothetical protein EWM62_13505 [Mucilaginibacter terrigena]